MDGSHYYSRRSVIGLLVASATSGCISSGTQARIEAEQEFDPDYLVQFQVSTTTNNRRSEGSCGRFDSNLCFQVRAWVTGTIDEVQGRTLDDQVVDTQAVAEAEQVRLDGERVNRLTLELAVMREGEQTERKVAFLREGEIIDEGRFGAHYIESRGLFG